jgi:hypothetical protein
MSRENMKKISRLMRVIERIAQLSYLDLRVVMAIMWTIIAMMIVVVYRLFH